jgi:hydroxylamine reductase (hybrid-cluster protein)
VKESIKFEETLNTLFGKYAYLFSTIYKLFDGLMKAMVMSSSCLLTSTSFKLMDQDLSEDH